MGTTKQRPGKAIALSIVFLSLGHLAAAATEPLSEVVQDVLNTTNRKDPIVAAGLERRLSDALASDPNPASLDVSNAHWFLVDLRSAIGDHRGAAEIAERFLVNSQMHPSARMDVAYRVAEQWFLADPLAEDRWLYFDRAQAIAEELAPRRELMTYSMRYFDIDLDAKRAHLLWQYAGIDPRTRDPRIDDPFLRAELLTEAAGFYDRYMDRLDAAGYPDPSDQHSDWRESERIGLMKILAQEQFDLATEIKKTFGPEAAIPVFREVADRLQTRLLEESGRDLIKPSRKEEFTFHADTALKAAFEFEDPAGFKARAEALFSEIPSDMSRQFLNQAEFMVLNGENLEMAAVLTLLDLKYRRKWHPDTYHDDMTYWSTLFRFLRLFNGKLVDPEALNQVLAYIASDADLIAQNGHALRQYRAIAHRHGLPDLPDKTTTTQQSTAPASSPHQAVNASVSNRPDASRQGWWWASAALFVLALLASGWLLRRRATG